METYEAGKDSIPLDDVIQFMDENLSKSLANLQ